MSLRRATSTREVFEPACNLKRAEDSDDVKKDLLRCLGGRVVDNGRICAARIVGRLMNYLTSKSWLGTY
jgi:hypothetical protein